MIKAKKRPSILLVDDDPFFLVTVGDFLRERNFIINSCRDVDEALGFLSKDDYDLVLSDIVMPDVDGIELLKTIRKKFPDLDVVFMTSQADINTAIKAIQLGAYDFIIKPVDFGELIWRIDKALEKAQLKKTIREHNRILTQKVEEQAERLRFLFFGAIETLVNAIEAKDEYTKGHSLRVTEYSVLTAKKIGIPFETASRIQLAARLHDVGKLGTSELILNKPAKLSSDEFNIIKSHPESGCDIMGPILEDDVLEIIRHHHERWDGQGYPGKLKGEEIPLGARIVCLADCFDAMTTERAYKKAMGFKAAYLEIEQYAGSRYDPELALKFIEIMTEYYGDSSR